jgi:hypothetical protein
VPPEFNAASLSLSFAERDRKIAIKESSDLVETAEEDEDDRVKEGRGLLLGCCTACCAADAKYDAGLSDRLAILINRVRHSVRF